MLLHNAEALPALYEFCRTLPPFNAIRAMPEADDVAFAWVKDKKRRAEWVYEKATGEHAVKISVFYAGHTVTLLASLLHEMCHIAVEVRGLDTGGNENAHNQAFRDLAAICCKVHGLDPKAFF